MGETKSVCHLGVSETNKSGQIDHVWLALPLGSWSEQKPSLGIPKGPEACVKGYPYSYLTELPPISVSLALSLTTWVWRADPFFLTC